MIKTDFQQGVKSESAQLNQNFIDLLALNVYNETPGGVINGANVNFTIAFAGKPNTTRIYLTGQTTIGMIRLRLGADYTETLDASSNVIGFQTTLPPAGGEFLVADYQKANV